MKAVSVLQPALDWSLGPKLGQTWNQNQNYSSITAAPHKIIGKTQLCPSSPFSTLTRVTDWKEPGELSDRDESGPCRGILKKKKRKKKR